MRGRAVVLPPPPETISPGTLRFVSADRPDVHAGQLVREGQTIFESRRDDRAGHVSPVAGRVTMVSPVEPSADKGDVGLHPARNGGYEITIEPSTPSVESVLRINPPRMRTLDQWLPVAKQFGLGTGRDGGVGLVAQLDEAQRRVPDAVVCVGADAFPPFPDRASLLASFGDDAALGTLILSEVAGAKQTILLAPEDSLVTRRLKPSCKNFGIRLLAPRDVYPLCDPTVLAWSLPVSPRRRRLERGANPASVGLVMIDPWTAIQIGRWFTLRKLDVVRPVFIARPGTSEPFSAVYAMHGQSLRSLPPVAQAAKDESLTIILDNPMTGRKIVIPAEKAGQSNATADTGTPTRDGARTSDAPAVSGDAARPPVLSIGGGLITIMAAAPPPEELPCISCGWCVQVCPTGLMPIDLVNLARRHPGDAHLADRLHWCIDCGLCSHVCPSAIPLAERLAASRSPVSVTSAPKEAVHAE